ncbi:MAG: sensor histidine kinase, partial [Caldilineaceae bacterium]|nr:sensor histidine kinase [Caldilineaceae bacterium]
MFHLRRYFSLASLLVFVIVTALLGMLYRTVAVRTFIELEERKNTTLTQLFANALWPAFDPLLEADADAPVIDLVQLRQAAVTQMTGLNVVKIKLYDRQGVTRFSTELQQIGENGADNLGFQQALQGVVASELTYRDKFSAFEGTIEKQNVLSTYLPVRPTAPDGEITAVFELYSNVTPLLHHINVTQWQLMSGVALILACLYGALLWIVGRADATIRAQRLEQQQAAQRLRQQQQTLAVLQERERLARELHDSLGQVLGYVNTQTAAARLFLAKRNYTDADELLHRLIKAANNAHIELRHFILQLQNGVSDEQDLVERLHPYLQQYQETMAPRTELIVTPPFHPAALPPATTIQLYRIVQEALNNVYKHAGAQRVTIRCAQIDQQVQISIHDDGRGFDPAQYNAAPLEGLGLRSMQARAEALGGSLTVTAQRGQGTHIA